MNDSAFPYATHLNVLIAPLQRFDVKDLAARVTDAWFNQTLCRVNDSVFRLGVMQGEYHWHKHQSDDELFFVLSGTFCVDFECHAVELGPWQGIVVPRGVVHRTRARDRAVIVMIETATIVPTGD